MNKGNSGDIHIVDIGIPKDAVEYVGPGELGVYYPRPHKQSHKGDNGSVLVIGGGPYVGAPALAGLAALRTGADLAFVVTPKRSWQAIASYSPNLIVQDLGSDIVTGGDVPIIQGFLMRCTAVVLGPGLGDAPETENAILNIIKVAVSKKKPLVIDADAIRPVGKNRGSVKNSATVITPHAGEFKELTGVALSDKTNERTKIVEHWAKKLGVTLLLKGYVDIISDGHQTKLNKVHTEAMTVGGTGDVLSGIIGALLAKGVDPYNAARTSAFVNGAAGVAAFNKYSYGLLATDVIEEIPGILQKYL